MTAANLTRRSLMAGSAAVVCAAQCCLGGHGLFSLGTMHRGLTFFLSWQAPVQA